MGKIIMVSSLKGGVGKTTVTAALAHSLAKMGFSTLAVDMDFGVRSLDIALGHENSASPSCWDVMMGMSSVGVAAESDARHDKLYFMSAPMNVNAENAPSLTQKLLNNFLRSVKQEFDYVILDMAAGTGRLLDMVRDSGDVSLSLIVCTQNAASIRAAEKLGAELYNTGEEKIRLIINSFDPALVGKGDNISITDIINHSSVMLLGVVPYDKRVELLLSSGKTVIEDKRSKAGIAIGNIARRITDECVGLLEGVFPKRKRYKLY